jgi:Spy/CpxP family protein refolding chaperone
MRRHALVAAAVMMVSTLLWTSLALAHGGWMHRSAGRGDLAILRAVGLTDDQKAQVRQIFANHRPQLQTLHQQLRAAERQLRDRLYGPNPPSVADLAPINKLREQLATERLQIALEVRNVLTPEQLARAVQIRQQLQQLRQQERSLLTPSS